MLRKPDSSGIMNCKLAAPESALGGTLLEYESEETTLSARRCLALW
jgi:hypothetical protein